MKKVKHFIHHLLFPRESNNHRPKVLHHDSLFFVLALFVFLGSVFGTVQKTHPQVLGISANISSQDLLTFTNQKRQENGLQPLVLNDQLTNAATQKASHMFANDYWAHIAPDGTTPWYFIKNSGYTYLYAGENLARGFTTAQAVVDAWMESPTHRENMLSKNYHDVGFAVQTGTLTGSETILVVEELGSKYETQSEVAPVAVSETTPTPVVAAAVNSPAPTKAVIPSVTQAPSQQIPTPTVAIEPSPIVAAVINQPLFNKQSVTKTIAIGLVVFLLLVLVIDAIIIERKQIARVVAHNIDHILFLLIIILIILILGKGFIL